MGGRGNVIISPPLYMNMGMATYIFSLTGIKPAVF